MKRTAVLDVVGLTRSLLGGRMPRLEALARQCGIAVVQPSLPAVTCTAQSNYLTGRSPAGHGIVANGWYDRSLAEVQFWKQSQHLVQAPTLIDQLRAENPGFTCAKLFWWYNMYSSADYSITPRPIYPADGRKVFDIYTWPYSIRAEIKADLGEFPFPAFWGPAAGVQSSRFTADAASRWIAYSAKWIDQKYQPTLSLVYLPHLDYNLQRLGPTHPMIDQDLRSIDTLVGELLDFYEKRDVQVIVLSEYGITSVETPIHLNRIFRNQGWLTVKDELGLELLDAGASKVFAVADHQIAHVYLNDLSIKGAVVELLRRTAGVAHVMIGADKVASGLDHPRAGDIVAVASEEAWFTYYYWLDDQRAPDFARTVDIHRKPGYDPVELFLDPAKRWVKARIAAKLLWKKLGFRLLMDLIPLDASLVKGSHGCIPRSEADWPVLICPRSVRKVRLTSTEVHDVVCEAVRG